MDYSGSRLRILIVDDEPWRLLPLQWSLRDAGYDVDEIVPEASQARRRLCENSYDLVIIDQLLPDYEGGNPAESGLRIVQFLRESDHEIPYGTSCDVPILIHSAYSSPEMDEMARRFQVPVLKKPCSPREVLRAVERELRRRSED